MRDGKRFDLPVVNHNRDLFDIVSIHIYKIIHLTGVLMVFISLGGLICKEPAWRGIGEMEEAGGGDERSRTYSGSPGRARTSGKIGLGLSRMGIGKVCYLVGFWGNDCGGQPKTGSGKGSLVDSYLARCIGGLSGGRKALLAGGKGNKAKAMA